MSRRAGACLVATLVVGGATAQADPQSPARAAANTMTFHDEAGEDAASPDITSVTVSNDARGDLTFRVSIPNRDRFTDEMRVGVRVDSTSAADGVEGEYEVYADKFGPHLFHCANPPTCDVFVADDPSSVRFSYAGGATLALAAGELGSAKSFSFAVEAWDGLVYGSDDFSSVHWDFAPDHNVWWTYETRPLIVESFSTTPTGPKAARRFTLHMSAVRTQTGVTVASGETMCVARIHGKRLKALSRVFAHGQATCAFAIPEDAKGKKMRATISIRSGGNTVARSISGTIG